MKNFKSLFLPVLIVFLLLSGCKKNATTTGTDVTTDPIMNNPVATGGTLNVSTLTSETGGKYAPRNIVAIWIKSNSGTYVKTLLVYANTYKSFLTNWASSSGYNKVDAISGATVNSHTTRTCTWNGTDKDGKVVGDGIYKLCMELTDKNSTGNYHEFTFTKGTSAVSLTPSNVSSFSNISIVWTPK